MPVGKWMEIIGMDSKAPGGRREGVIPPPVTRPASQRTAQLREQSARELLSKEDSSPSPPPEKEKQERKVVKKEEKEHGGWEPWLEIQRGNFNPVKVCPLSSSINQELYMPSAITLPFLSFKKTSKRLFTGFDDQGSPLPGISKSSAASTKLDCMAGSVGW